MKTQELVLIRGLPGSGKSTLAKRHKGYIHCEADDFFLDAGEYKFDRTKLSAAHAACLSKAERNIRAGFNVVVANTFSQRWEVQPYLDLAKSLGVSVRILEAQGQWDSIHNVPKQAIQRMKDRWEEIDLEKNA